MATHTPTPWHVREKRITPDRPLISAEHCGIIADCKLTSGHDGTDRTAKETNEANAELIVRAVNCHADLLATLEALALASEELAGSDLDTVGHADTCKQFDVALDAAKEIIARAKGE